MKYINAIRKNLNLCKCLYIKLGTRRRELTADSGFSQWLAAGNSNCKEDNYAANTVISCTDNDTSLITSQSPTGIHRDNTPSSLQRPDKHSQHSSLQNIQGDLNDILDRLQNMVANDCFDGKLCSMTRKYVHS